MGDDNLKKSLQLQLQHKRTYGLRIRMDRRIGGKGSL
jgi:hypothetical protein